MSLAPNYRKLHRSYSVWVGAIIMAVSALQANLSTVQSVIDPKVFAWTTFGLGVAAVVLRYIKQECIENANTASNSTE